MIFQPNQETAQKEEAEKILLAAQKRGQEALFRLREEEKARRRANDDRRFQLLNVRAVEEARSAAVVALPCPESTVGLKRYSASLNAIVFIGETFLICCVFVIYCSTPPKAPVSIVAPPSKVCVPSKTSMPEWPKKLWPQQPLPLGITHTKCDNEQVSFECV